jgi:hypothetical protein
MREQIENLSRRGNSAACRKKNGDRNLQQKSVKKTTREAPEKKTGDRDHKQLNKKALNKKAK